MVRQWQEFFYERRYAATPLSGPDFVKLAEAFGIRGTAVTDARRGAWPRSTRRAPTRGRVVIDFRVEQEDTVFPMVPAGADLHEMIRRPNADRRNRRRTCRTRISTMTMHTFAVYVEDEPGVLNRVASLFRRRGFNIESLDRRPHRDAGRLADDDRRRRPTTAARGGSRRTCTSWCTCSAVEDITERAGGRPRSGADQGRRATGERAPQVMQLADVFRRARRRCRRRSRW